MAKKIFVKERKLVGIRINKDYYAEIENYLLSKSKTFNSYAIELIINDFENKKKELQIAK